MDAQNIFNLILLTLSLATILLTLVSYILYRAKQATGPAPQGKKLKLDGIFFRRYLPAAFISETEKAAAPTKIKVQRDFIIIPKKIVPFFILICVVIFFSLFLSNALKHNHTSAVSGTLRIKPGELESAAVEKINPEVLDPFSNFPSLREKVVYFYPLSRASGFASQASWKTYFERSGFTHFATNSKGADLIFLPQAFQLTDPERSEIEQMITSGKSVVATGPLGFLNGFSKEDANAWASKWFGVHFEISPHPNEYLPLLSSGQKTVIDLPPGTLLDWAPTDNHYVALANDQDAVLAFESDHAGHPKEYARAVIHRVGSSRTLWMAMDPNDHLEAYSSYLLSSSLRWLTHLPMSKIANWPGDKPGAFLLSVDSEDQFSNLEALITCFKKARAPATFMVVSELYAKEPTLIPKAGNQYEIASHSEDHSIFEGQSIDEQYNRIQTSLTEIEGINKTIVNGFRAPEERSDNATLVAITKLGLKWVATKALFNRRAPVWIADGQLLDFARVNVDDYWTVKNKVSIENISKILINEASESFRVGGMDMLNMHTQFFGKAPYPELISKVLQEIALMKPWQPTYSEAYHWWDARSHTAFEFNPKSQSVTLHNWSKSDLEEAVLIVDDGKEIKKIPISLVSSGQSKRVDLKSGSSN